MAKGQTVAIWIILVVVLAAAAGVIAIVVQNAKRESQLSKVEEAAALYESNNPAKPAASTLRKRVDVQHPSHPQQGHASRASRSGRPSGRRMDMQMLQAEAHSDNRLPPRNMDTYYNNTTSAGMTVFNNTQTAPAELVHFYPPQSANALFVPNKSPQAEMPAQQLFVSDKFPDVKVGQLQGYNASPEGVGQVVDTTASPFLGSSYFQDPAEMTPNTYADGLGLDAYMPNVSNATPDGLDPQTGLPVFSTSSLRRSNLLSGRGVEGFLRPVVDDTQGYKRVVGKNMCPCIYNNGHLNERRNQYNAARLTSGIEPVLFYQTDPMYIK